MGNLSDTKYSASIIFYECNSSYKDVTNPLPLQNLHHSSHFLVISHDFNAMWMRGCAGENAFYDSFSDFAGTLVMLLDKRHIHSWFDVFSFGFHLAKIVVLEQVKTQKPPREVVYNISSCFYNLLIFLTASFVFTK